MKYCPCGSKKHYKNCCQLIHHDPKNALKPEQLMRARFSAYALNLVDFIAATYHPSCNAHDDIAGIEAGCRLKWIKLVIKRSSSSGDDEEFVHFKAFYEEKGQRGCLEEKSRFIKSNDLWFYIDGQLMD
jgi:SEC-C motif-containing protein